MKKKVEFWQVMLNGDGEWFLRDGEGHFMESCMLNGLVHLLLRARDLSESQGYFIASVLHRQPPPEGYHDGYLLHLVAIGV